MSRKTYMIAPGSAGALSLGGSVRPMSLHRDHSAAPMQCAELNETGPVEAMMAKSAVRQGAGIDGCILASRQLPVDRPDLSLR
jgi:hypothetical protein